jgi:hypothetical protein
MQHEWTDGVGALPSLCEHSDDHMVSPKPPPMDEYPSVQCNVVTVDSRLLG